MNVIWGLIVAIFGAWLARSAQRESTNSLYQLIVVKSRILWKDNVHRFHLYAGAGCLAAGLLIATR